MLAFQGCRSGISGMHVPAIHNGWLWIGWSWEHRSVSSEGLGFRSPESVTAWFSLSLSCPLVSHIMVCFVDSVLVSYFFGQLTVWPFQERPRCNHIIPLQERDARSVDVQEPPKPSQLRIPLREHPTTHAKSTHFKDSDRRSFSCLIQFCTGHVHIGE